jgi:hypothetical protein
MNRSGSLSDELTAVTAVILNAGSSGTALEDASRDLFAYLFAPVRELLDSSSRDPIALSSGIAISPLDAASCSNDVIRTAVLLRGVDAALRDALARFRGEIVEVVYAGSGPLAPLIIPLLPLFAGDSIRITFIDAHPEAIESVRRILGEFGLLRFAGRFVCGDATAYEHPGRLHVVITETMQRALTREPQVAITRHLAKQLLPHGILIPESIKVELEIGSPPQQESVPQPPSIVVGTLLDLRRDVENFPLDDDKCLPAVRLVMPPHDIPAGAVAMYRTTITAYGEHVIAPEESGLTQPEIVWDLPLKPCTELEFRYQIAPVPGFRWRGPKIVVR